MWIKPCETEPRLLSTSQRCQKVLINRTFVCDLGSSATLSIVLGYNDVLSLPEDPVTSLAMFLKSEQRNSTLGEELM